MHPPFVKYPQHLYHADKPAVIAYDDDTAAKAFAAGYTVEYQHQAYPKTVHGWVGDETEQHVAEANGYCYHGSPMAAYPHLVSRTFLEDVDEQKAAVREFIARDDEREADQPASTKPAPPVNVVAPPIDPYLGPGPLEYSEEAPPSAETPTAVV